MGDKGVRGEADPSLALLQLAVLQQVSRARAQFSSGVDRDFLAAHCCL